MHFGVLKMTEDIKYFLRYNIYRIVAISFSDINNKNIYKKKYAIKYIQ